MDGWGDLPSPSADSIRSESLRMVGEFVLGPGNGGGAAAPPGNGLWGGAGPGNHEVAMKTKTIRQTVVLPGTPQQVYEALMTTHGHEAFTGAEARISTKVGGSFMAWGGYIHGKNLKLVPGKTIYQTWVPAAKGWPKGHLSKVRFTLTKSPRGTRLTFTHSGVPEEHVGHLAPGWKESYWTPLRKYLASH